MNQIAPGLNKKSIALDAGMNNIDMLLKALETLLAFMPSLWKHKHKSNLAIINPEFTTSSRTLN